MESIKNSFFLAIGLAVILGSFYLVLQKPAPEKYQSQALSPIVKVGDSSIKVEIANTPEERELGLSGRESLETLHGILFIFEQPAIYPFWMKEMNFPIDIVWIDENWQVVGIEREILPESFPQTFNPSRPVKYVLELNSGEAEFFGIDMGSQVYFEAQK